MNQETKDYIDNKFSLFAKLLNVCEECNAGLYIVNGYQPQMKCSNCGNLKVNNNILQKIHKINTNISTSTNTQINSFTTSKINVKYDEHKSVNNYDYYSKANLDDDITYNLFN